MFKSFFEQTFIPTVQHQTTSVQEHTTHKSFGRGFYKEDKGAKQGNHLIGYSSSGWLHYLGKPSQLFVVGCNPEAFTGADSGSGFSLLTQEAPRRWSCL